MTAVLTATGLGKRFGRKWALRGCSVEIPEGRIAGLVGPNGAGKSTLLQLAVGLLDPTEGSVEVVGGRAASSRKPLRARGGRASHAVRTPRSP